MQSFYTALTSLSGRYSKALFLRLSEKTKGPKELLKVLENLLMEGEDFLNLLHKDSTLFQVLMTPTVPRTLRKKVLERLSKTLGLTEIFHDFLILLNQRQRLTLLKDCLLVLNDMHMREASIFPVTIKSATPLSKTDTLNVQKTLFEKLNTLHPMAKPIFTLKTEPELLAGYRIEIPGMVLDASFKKQLEQLQTYIHEGAL